MKKTVLILSFFYLLKTTYTQPVSPDTSLGSNNVLETTSETSSHSDFPTVQYHLTAREWKPSDVSRSAYLSNIESTVRAMAKFQDGRGAIIDPYLRREEQYSTPYFANAVATLVSVGRARDLLKNGIAAMNKATADIEGGRKSIPDDHGEFFVAPLASAISLYAPHVDHKQAQIWKKRMGKSIEGVIKGRNHNWRTYAMKGEWYRAMTGYVNKNKAVKWIENSWINSQKSRITNNHWNFYHDASSDPDSWAYESVARSNLLAMVADGYSGASRNEILTALKKGTQSSLLLQDPTGQAPTSGRSSNHVWNDLLSGNGYETLAEIVYKEGNLQLAGQYRHAAALAFKSVQRWRRNDGSYSVTKNLFDPKARTRYASYSFFAHYNGNMMYHMAENFLRLKSSITEQPTPNEIGGYTILSDNAFATAAANAGGMHMQVCLRGSTQIKSHRYWTALGVVRFARTGWDSRLGPSDGVREEASRLGVSFAPTFFENGSWLRLASLAERYEAVFTTQFTHPLLVRCRVVYKPKSGKKGPTFTNDFVITPDGILSTVTSTERRFGVTWPVLTFDGATKLTTQVTSHIANASFSGQGDQQNFIALHSSPQITSGEVKRSSYGDLLPLRMVSGSTNNITFIYPRSSSDPLAETVRQSFTQSGNDFSTALATIKGNTYIGRTSAGGVGTSIDVDKDGNTDAFFSTTTGFILQLSEGQIKKIESDRDVTAVIYGKTVNLQAYKPVSVDNSFSENESTIIASSDDSNVAANTVDKDFDTRWSAMGDNQWIRYYLDKPKSVETVKIAWYKGDQRQASFDIQTSLDGIHWTTVFTGKSSGTTAGFETYNVSVTTACYVRIIGHGNTLNTWTAITEVEILTDESQPPTLVLKEVNDTTKNQRAVSNRRPTKKTSYPANTIAKNISRVKSRPVSISRTKIISKELGLKLFPNPTNDILNVVTDGFKEDKFLTLTVISSTGVVIKTIQSSPLNKNISLNLSSLESGVYTLKVLGGDKVLVKQFVKL